MEGSCKAMLSELWEVKPDWVTVISEDSTWARCSVFVFAISEIAGDWEGYMNSETLLLSCKKSCEFFKSYLAR